MITSSRSPRWDSALAALGASPRWQVVDVARAFEHTQPDFEDTMPLHPKHETEPESGPEVAAVSTAAESKTAASDQATIPTCNPPAGGSWRWDPSNRQAVAGGWINLDEPKED